MSKEIEIQSAICPEMLDETPIAVGYDSEVYRLGDRVLKIYNRSADNQNIPSDPETLLLYWQLTNRLSEIAEAENFVFQVPYTEKKYPIRVNPVAEMYECKHCGHVTSVSLYIPGNNLKMFPQEFDPEELHIGLRNLSLDWERKFKVSGISLIPLNIKKDAGPMMITDLCSDISKLRQRIF